MTQLPQSLMGQTITASTPSGPVSGRIVGLETRDPSRHGTGAPQQLVCIALDPPGDAWLWLPASEVTG